MKNNDIRICTSCHFLFEGNPDYGCCPDCGKPTIREADDKETAEEMTQIINRFLAIIHKSFGAKPVIEGFENLEY